MGLKTSLIFGLGFFKKIYLFSAVLTGLYVLICVGVILYFTGVSEVNLLQLSVSIVFNACKFTIWYFICDTLLGLFRTDTGPKLLSKRMNRIGKLLVGSFFVDLASLTYGLNISSEPKVDWSAIHFPSLSESFPVILHGFFQIFFWATITFSGFLTPTIDGIACIFIALICFQTQRYFDMKSGGGIQES